MVKIRGLNHLGRVLLLPARKLASQLQRWDDHTRLTERPALKPLLGTPFIGWKDRHCLHACSAPIGPVH